MKHLPKISGISIVTYFMASLISSCSLIGYGIGSAIDSGQEKRHSLRAGDDLDNHIGDDAIFHKRDHREYEGIYQGTTLYSEESYYRLYRSRSTTDISGMLFPLDSKLTMQTPKFGEQTFEFHGFTHDGIIDEKNNVIRYKDISWIADEKKRVPGSDAERMALAGELPLRDAFYCDKYRTVIISANDISDIVVSSQTHWATGLGLTGVALDIICIGLAIHGLNTLGNSFGGFGGGW